MTGLHRGWFLGTDLYEGWGRRLHIEEKLVQCAERRVALLAQKKGKIHTGGMILLGKQQVRRVTNMCANAQGGTKHESFLLMLQKGADGGKGKVGRLNLKSL